MEYTVNYQHIVVATGVVTTGGQKHFTSVFGVHAFIMEFMPAPGIKVAGTVFCNGVQVSSFERWGPRLTSA